MNKKVLENLSQKDKDLLLEAIFNNLSIEHIESTPEMREVKFNITLHKFYDTKEGAWVRNEEIEKQNDLLLDFVKKLLEK